jgi:hypothetical protein
MPAKRQTKATEYRRQAALCLAAAEQMSMYPEHERMLAMAQQWLAMAGQWLAIADKAQGKPD